ncbi:hypothetical protein NE235_09105 [Actinoallomurus spadix]|uniref:Uncharacterized protein n=1 Tax=Actinoallomurus spadix TaxID=79912 RepID=A0ABN0W6L4_9ACTN|nr:hypothetical protein [Actinoallomurus spadix]MCO5986265.1 hypothetical protein [Actinoallomurus spadix]
MPCYRCGARQTDPDHGPSPWRRGVRSDRQVLVCPDCQHGRDWTADLDHCTSCGATALVCRLGEVECRTCGRVRATERMAEPPAPSDGSGLSEEVAAALSRVLGGDGLAT